MCPDRKVIFSGGNWGGLIYKWKSPHLVMFCNCKVQKSIFNLRNKQHISVFGMIGIFFHVALWNFDEFWHKTTKEWQQFLLRKLWQLWHP
jgi:hypothetical protein